MCYGCYRRHGAPKIDSLRIRKVAKLVDDLYEYEISGGNLHVVVDDFNIEDRHLDFCSTQPCDALETEIIGEMRRLTVRERASALGIQNGFWNPMERESWT